MNWKKLPYWVKGGLIGVVAISSSLILNKLFPDFANPISLVVSLFLFPLGLLFFGAFYLPQWIIIVEYIYFFLLGAIIGKIYEKIKSRSHKKGKRK